MLSKLYNVIPRRDFNEIEAQRLDMPFKSRQGVGDHTGYGTRRPEVESMVYPLLVFFLMFFFLSQLKFSFCSWNVSLILLNCLSVLSCGSLTMFRIIFFILSSLTGNSLCPFLLGQLLETYCVPLVVIFSWFFRIPIAFCRCLFVWRRVNSSRCYALTLVGKDLHLWMGTLEHLMTPSSDAGTECGSV